jgi:hypothetical protein
VVRDHDIGGLPAGPAGAALLVQQELLQLVVLVE